MRRVSDHSTQTKSSSTAGEKNQGDQGEANQSS